MSMAPRTSGRVGRAGVAVAAGSVLLTACASGAAKDPSQENLHDKLPAAVRSAAVLKVGVDLNYAPVEFKSSGDKPDGLDPDLAKALGEVLGVRVEFVDTPFDKLIPNLHAKNYDMVMSAMTDNRQRRDGTDDSGKQIDPGVDFVDYFIAGTSIVVAKNNPQNIQSIDDLCGRTIALQRGTTQAAIIQRQTSACEKVKKTLTIKLTESDNEALSLVAGGKAVADLNDFPVAAYVAQQGQNGAQFAVAGSQLQASPYGIAFTKENSELRDVTAKALDRIIRNGEYEKILGKWGVGAGAAQNAVINGGF
ncbi:polar amino acid transport system substrate-binding protein [Kitasatospora paracochleata]|uniref:Polar amino acid transport system substrate-binding protein n=2 Tax=Kitasatospora paracochleata TaxID=58354 RepID=A0ABT1IQY2_9ACTN|nr:polar amino acid transport system substrate-binding protein [Kitasatospora paracochleata]